MVSPKVMSCCSKNVSMMDATSCVAGGNCDDDGIDACCVDEMGSLWDTGGMTCG